MASLTGTQIANTYKQLLQVGSGNVGLTSSLQTVQDGDATNSPLQLSDSAVNINGTFQLSGVTLTANASTLNAVADLTGATGIVAVSAGNVYGRTLVAGTGIIISNADGTEGNPTIAMVTAATSGSYKGPNDLEVNAVGQIVSISPAVSVSVATIKSAAFEGGTFVGSSGGFETNVSMGGNLTVNGNATLQRIVVSAVDLTRLSATSGEFSGTVSAGFFVGDGSGITNLPVGSGSMKFLTAGTGVNFTVDGVTSTTIPVSGTVNLNANQSFGIVSATNIDADELLMAGVSAANVTEVAAVSVLTKTNLDAITSINSVIGDGTGFVTDAELAATSVALATSIGNSNTNIAAVSVLTSVNLAAITSINSVIGDGSGFVTDAELAATSVALATSIGNSNTNITTNTNAITSINSVIGDGSGFATDAELAAVSAALATSIGNSNTRITSVSNFAVALSATMATSIGNSNTNITTNTNAITSINSVIGDGSGFATDAELAAVSATMATSINNSNTNIAAVSVLTSVNLAAITSINSVIGDGSGFVTDAELAATSVALATSIGNSNTNITTNTNAITSINSVIGDGSGFATDAELAAVSATMATSIGNSNTNITTNTNAITSITNLNTQDVTLAGTPDYISIINQVITRNQIDLAADVTGNLPVSNLNAGTGASGSSFWRGDGVWATPSGSGDVVGPASSTDNAIARFDSTTGKLLQNSTVTISDAGAIAAGSLTLTTDLAVADGGTGASTFTANGVLVGNGTGAVTATAVGTSGQVLTSNGSGSAPTFQAAGGGGATDINGLSDAKKLGTNTYGIGSGALAEATASLDGGRNTAIGTDAGGGTKGNGTGNNPFDNTFVGDSAGYGVDQLGTTAGNVAIGRRAMWFHTGCINNVIIGKDSGAVITTGSQNVAVGYEAAKALTTGNTITAIGNLAGSTATTGTNNTIIGNSAAPSSVTVSNEITLGNSSIATLRCQVQTISSLSDRRDKKDIEELPLGIDFINTLKPVKFTWNMRDGAKVGQQEAGFIAQDLDEAQIDADAEDYLNLVLKNNPEKLEASYGKLVPVLVKAVQELSAEVATLKKEIENGK